MGSLADKIRRMIESEDERLPLTDSQLATALGVERPYVTRLRNELGIPDSRGRLKQTLDRILQQPVHCEDETEQERLSLTEVHASLKDAGFRVSRRTLRRLMRDRDTAVRSKPPGSSPRDPFASVIGHDGDLKSCVDLAKAAVLYPPNGLHTLIVGETGVGKNLFAEAMYRFGVESRVLDPSSPFVHFNCADYANNPQLLLSQLFGHTRGAYTGAEGEKPGVAERASGGVLFLDEVHRLPPEGQEILFRLIDTGRFRRLGETGAERTLPIRLIAATTEKPEAILLDAFRRRIPVLIEIPPLEKRSRRERFKLLTHFFREESARVRARITVSRDALVSLMLYSPKGNIGQLKSDIQVSIARAFLRSVTEHTEGIRVEVSTLPAEAQKGLIKASSMRYSDELLASLRDMVFEGDESPAAMSPPPCVGEPDETVYDYIEARWRQLKQSSFSEDEIGNIVGHEVEQKISANLKRSGRVFRDDLIKVVGAKLVLAVEGALGLAGFPLAVTNPNLPYYLALHLHASISRLRQGKPVINPRLSEIRASYPAEFELARKILRCIEADIGMTLPDAEAGFVALYLRNASTARPEQPEVGLVVMTHGRVAGSLLEVAHRLMGESDARSVEMSLDENPEDVMRRAADAVIQANKGRGVLILADMGSLTTFGPIISKSTGIPTRTVERVDAVLVMEAMRRIRFSRSDLDELASQLGEIAGSRPEPAEQPRREAVILTVCLTGRGTAEHLKSLLDHVLAESTVEIRPIGVFGSGDLSQAISRIRVSKDVLAVVGTVDPEYPGIPFIPVEEVITGKATTLLKPLLRQRRSVSLRELFDESLCTARLKASNKEEVIQYVCGLLQRGGFVRDGFYESVLERESLAPTCMYDGEENPMAIPHPLVTGFTRKSAVAVTTLALPVEWGGLAVDLVFLIAYTSRDRALAETFFHTILNNTRLLAALRAASTNTELYALLHS